jgi:hypothetical protein
MFAKALGFPRAFLGGQFIQSPFLGSRRKVASAKHACLTRAGSDAETKSDFPQ